MGQWAKTGNNNYSLIGSGRTALIAGETLPTAAAFRLQLRRPDLNDGIFANVLESKDGRSGYQIGLAGTKIVVRTIEFGDPASEKLWVSVNHGLNVTQPWTLEVRYINGAIEARLNGATSAVASFTPGSAAGTGGTAAGSSPTFAGYKHFGFESGVDGAVVVSAVLCTLVPQTANRADLMVAACGGDAFIIEKSGDTYTKRLIRSGVFNPTGDVSMVEFEQKVYAVDGAHAVVIDALLVTAAAWTLTAGSLPGQTTAGTTTASIIETYRGRLWLAGMPADPQNLYASAVNDPLDWDTGADRFGRAFGLSPAQIGKIGQPITCLARSTRSSLVIGCNASIWELVGDPATGNPELSEILNKTGISGKDAFTSIAEGRLVVHTPDGAYLLPSMGEPIPLSAAVLTERINIDRGDIADYAVQVRRDPTRNLVYYFLTPRAGGAALHFAYDERVGGYSPASGGWFPDDFAQRFGPTASTPQPFLGRVVWGSRDGWLMALSNDRRIDGVGSGPSQTVNPRLPMDVMHEAKINRETILHKFAVQPGNGCTVKYRVWGGLTAQQIYTGHAAGPDTGRYLLQYGDIPDDFQWRVRKSRAPAMMIELYSDADEPFEVEDADAVTTVGRLLTRRDLVAASAPGAPCDPPFYPISASTAGTSYGSGPGGGSENPPTGSIHGNTIGTLHTLTIGGTGACTVPGDVFDNNDTVCPTMGPVTISPSTVSSTA